MKSQKWNLKMERIKSEDTIKAQSRIHDLKFKNYIEQSVDIYSKIFLIEYGRKPAPDFIMKKMKRKNSKYYSIFSKIIKFLESELKKNNAVNPMNELLEDYFRVLISYYRQFNRIPTINQLSPGEVSMNLFLVYSHNEHNNKGGYWLSKEKFESSQKLIQNGGTKYFDPILDEILNNPHKPTESHYGKK